MGNNSGNKLKLLTIPLDGQTITETDKAYGFTVDAMKVWLPKSQIEDWTETDGQISFYLPEWLIVDKELEPFIDTSHEPSLFE